MNFEDLKNPELQEKLKAAKTEEELMAIVAAQGIDLSNEMLQAISGGMMCRGFCGEHCPAVCYNNEDGPDVLEPPAFCYNDDGETYEL